MEKESHIKEPHNKKRLSSFQIIVLGFVGVILTGAILLTLPISSKSGEFTSFMDALFTSTSAVCVTGLVVQDTATYWSIFGQAIILILIQIGGMGVITVAATLALLSGRKISLMQRSTMQEAIAAPKVGGIVRLTRFIIITTIIIEATGAAVMMPVFVRDFGLRGIWMAVFHSVSAFCNAGFDLLGTEEAKFASLTGYSASPVINLTIMALIVTGGIGFLTWDDIKSKKLRFRQYRMQSKVILVTTAIMIAVPAVYFFIFDFSGMPLGERILASLFQSVTPRTAGFNTVDLTKMTGASIFMITLLMVMGGSPGSTAGGMKTTTVAVLFANCFAVFRRKNNAQFFGRRIEDEVIKSASTISAMYVGFPIFGAILISTIEGLPVMTTLFETSSALGTVGLTLGITTEIGTASRLILIMLMFLGRVGGLTLIYATLASAKNNLFKLPAEKITVG